jgi:alkaline phosphatase D
MVATFSFDNLNPDTPYHYEIEVNDVVVEEKRGRFKTFPPEDQPASFKFVCAGDADTGSNDRVFEFILREDPLFFCHLGDLHYENVHKANTIIYRKAYAEALNARRQADLYRNIPIVYTWDDHDFDNNDANMNAPGRKTARLAYQQCVPHYQLVEGKGDVAIYHAFTVGRVRFLISDTRSERTPKDEDDDEGKSMLGRKQKEWLKQELLAGREKYPLVVWVSSVPWIGKRKKRSDSWFGYATERDEIGAFIEENNINNLCMLAADAHMLAIDDGSNNRGEFGRGRFPVFQAAPLDSTRSVKGGPFLLGPFLDDSGQYGVFTVEDTGGPTVSVTWEGKNINEGVLMSFPFNSPRG